MNRFWAVSGIVLVFSCARSADASAIYAADASAMIEFLGFDQQGGPGVEVFPDALVDFESSRFEDDAFAQSWTDVSIALDRIELEAFSVGQATRGEALSNAGITGGFWVDNTHSLLETTALFRVSGMLRAQTALAGSAGLSSAYASFDFDSVESRTVLGVDLASHTVDPFLASFTVPAGDADFFSVSLYTEGATNATPTITEPSPTAMLAFGLLVLALLFR